MSIRCTGGWITTAICQIWTSMAAAAGIPPVCDAGGPYLAAEGEEILFDATGSMDPDGEIVEYVWDFGDGTGGSGAVVMHIYATAGIYTVVLGVADDDGNVASCETTADVEGEIPDLPRDQTLEDYVVQVDRGLPPFDSMILDAPPGPDWMEDMSVERVSASMNDEVPGTILTEDPVWIAYDTPDSTNTRYVKLDFQRGYVRYLSEPRQFEWGDPEMSVPDDVALNVFSEAMDALGLPGQEWSAPRVDLVLETGFDDDTAEESTLEVERLVTLPREVNGYPVFGSMARMAVSNRAEAARALVRWPMFRLVEDPELMTRDEVVQEIAQRIWQVETGVDVHLDMRIGYAPTPAGYVPVARVGITDRDGVLEGGAIELVPLITSIAAGTLDGATPTAASLRVLAKSGGRVRVEFVLPASERVVLAVYDVVGRRVRTLVDRDHEAGPHATSWDGHGESGLRLASGVYVVRLETGRDTLFRKLTLLW